MVRYVGNLTDFEDIAMGDNFPAGIDGADMLYMGMRQKLNVPPKEKTVPFSMLPIKTNYDNLRFAHKSSYSDYVKSPVVYSQKFMEEYAGEWELIDNNPFYQKGSDPDGDILTMKSPQFSDFGFWQWLVGGAAAVAGVGSYYFLKLYKDYMSIKSDADREKFREELYYRYHESPDHSGMSEEEYNYLQGLNTVSDPWYKKYAGYLAIGGSFFGLLILILLLRRKK